MRNVRYAVVTGPTGAIGSALCRLLCEKGIRVYAVIRPDSKRAEHLKQIPGAELIECELSESARLPKLVAKLRKNDHNNSCIDVCDGNSNDTSDNKYDIIHDGAFFHLAWAKTTGAGRNDMYAQIDNIRYTIDAVHAAKELGCSVFIGAGSQAEYGRIEVCNRIADSNNGCNTKESFDYDNLKLKPDTPCFPENGYGMAKLCAGQMSRIECGKLGIDHIWPRILSIYGPYDGQNSMISIVARKLLSGEEPSLTAGEQQWDYLYADDAAEALYRMAVYGKNGNVYPLGSGEARPLHEYIEQLRDAIDPSLPLGFGQIPYSAKQVMHLQADISALREDTGFEPRTAFEEGIRKTIEHYQKHE